MKKRETNMKKLSENVAGKVNDGIRAACIAAAGSFVRFREIYRNMILVIAGLMVASNSHAADGLVGILENVGKVAQAGGQATVYIAMAAGIIFGFISFLILKSMGGQGASQQPGKVSGLVTTFIAAVFLIYYGATLEVGGETIFGGSNGTADSVNKGDFGL